MPRWRLDAGPAGQRPVAPLATARDRSFTFNLTEPSTGTFTIDARSDDAALLEELVTDVHLLRDGVAIWTGRVMSIQDTIDDRQHKATITCTDLRGVLTRRLTRQKRDWSTGVPAPILLRDLLNEAQASPYTTLGYSTAALGETGPQVKRTSEAGQPTFTEVQALQGGTDGGSSVFDWDITPGWVNRAVQFWAPQRGRDLTGPGGLTLQYRQARPGARTPAFGTIQRGFDPATYGNVLTVTGGTKIVPTQFTTVNPSTGATEIKTGSLEVPTTPVTVVDQLGVEQFGAWAVVEAYPDIIEQAELQAKAESRLKELTKVAASYTFPLRQGLWQGPDTLWLGDVARVVVSSGRVQDDVALRITQITLGLDSSGKENVTAVAGNPPRTDLTEQQSTKRRLVALEQH